MLSHRPKLCVVGVQMSGLLTPEDGKPSPGIPLPTIRQVSSSHWWPSACATMFMQSVHCFRFVLFVLHMHVWSSVSANADECM